MYVGTYLVGTCTIGKSDAAWSVRGHDEVGWLGAWWISNLNVGPRGF